MSIPTCLMALSQTASTSFSPVSFAVTWIVLMRPRPLIRLLKKPVRTSRYHLRDVRKQWDRIYGVCAIVLDQTDVLQVPDRSLKQTVNYQE